jgi:DNA-binding CsgD family transcriptional regulator
MTGWVEEEWLELLADLMASPVTELPVEPISRQLIRTFDGVACAFSAPCERADSAAVEVAAVEVVEWIVPALGALLIKRVHPARRPAGTVVAWNCPHQLGVPLSPDGCRAFVLGRHVEFADREIELGRRIRRLIVGLDQQARRFAADRAAGAANPRITPREQAVLGELARGVTAAVISRRLGISERTVHKHLEHIYGKLDVTDRLSAVLRAREAGLIAAR